MEGLSLKGRVAVVTGAGRGIGASAAAHLAELGASVVLASRSPAELAQVTQFIVDRGGRAMPVVCDVTQEEQVARLFAEAAERFGPVDVLVNNAGAVEVAPLAELSRASWERLVAVNLTAAFLCCQAALRQMLERRAGVIVNVGSVSGVPGVEKLPGLVGYAATKGGLLLLSEALAAEVRPAGIRVVAVSPASVNTRMLQEVAPDVAKHAMTPGKVGKLIAFLASDAAAAVTQANLTVWGPPAGAG